jgi:hypothetical protein
MTLYLIKNSLTTTASKGSKASSSSRSVPSLFERNDLGLEALVLQRSLQVEGK